MKPFLSSLTALSLFLLIFSATSCQKELEQGERGLKSEAFYERYNKFIVKWLSDEKFATQEAIDAKKTELTASTDSEEQERIQGSIDDLQRKIDSYTYRESLGDYFAFGDESEIPEGLVWEDGMEQPEIGDPAAVKGGSFRYFFPSFPPTLRKIGSDSNNFTRGDLNDNIDVYLVHLHPVTQELIPGIAKEWAVGPDKKTVYFRIHPDAKFNDGSPIVAEDFMTWARLRLDDNVNSIWFKQTLRESFAQFKVYTPHLISISLPEEKPLLAFECGSFAPEPTGFYKDFGADFEERYQWVRPPSTSAYRLDPGDLVKGESITLTRVDDWWLKDSKFYRYRYNADKLSYRIVRDLSKAWELFRVGELDYFPITLPEFYYEKSEIPAVFNGYIERTTWYNQYPRIPWGFYLNTAEPPLDNKMVRRGIAYASNWDKVIDVVFRGDYSRLQGFTSGYSVTNPDVKALPFSVKKAREAFAEAGYDREDKDGILMNAQGQRLDLEITYSTDSVKTRQMIIIKEEARRAGVNFILDDREATASFAKATSKEHQLYYSAWGFMPPYPRYYEYFHSRNAYDEKGNRKAQTNNVFSYADPEMDVLVEAYRNARTVEELKEYALKIQTIIADENLFIPGFTNEFARVANWRWVRWPDTPETRFSPPLAYIPLEGYCYWIDPEMKKETLAARKSGKEFPEVERVVEDYRTPRINDATVDVDAEVVGEVLQDEPEQIETIPTGQNPAEEGLLEETLPPLEMNQNMEEETEE